MRPKTPVTAAEIQGLYRRFPELPATEEVGQLFATLSPKGRESLVNGTITRRQDEIAYRWAAKWGLWELIEEDSPALLQLHYRAALARKRSNKQRDKYHDEKK